MPKQTQRLHKPTNGSGSQDIPATISPDQANIFRLAFQHWLERGYPIESPEEDWSWAEQGLKDERTRTEDAVMNTSPRDHDERKCFTSEAKLINIHAAFLIAWGFIDRNPALSRSSRVSGFSNQRS